MLVDDDVSAYCRKKRPAFERLVSMLQSGVSTVVAYHADRLYRRMTDLERLVDIVESNGAQVYTVAAGHIDLTTASGRMVARIVGATAQGESERMGERGKMKGDELASKGRAPGGRPPFGYSWANLPDPISGNPVRSYVVNPNEAETVRMLARRALEGASMLGLARELDKAGIATRGGRPWHSSAVRAVLLNPAIAALRIHRREVAGPGTWEPILDRATWEEVRAVIADPARKRTRPARHYLLAGLVENPSGDRMNGHSHGHSAGGVKNRRVYATRTGASRSLTIGADDLEKVVVEAMLQRLDKALLPEPESVTDTGTEVAEIEAELVTLANLRGQGTISLAEWLAARVPFQRRLEAARAAAGTTRRPTAMTAMLRKPGAVRRAWEGDRLTFAEKREILTTMLEKIVVLPAARGRWTPIEKRIDPRWRG